MEQFIKHEGIAAPINRVNIDTDAIIPKQFLRKIERTGFGVHLFHEWRYTDYEGTKENPDFILNQDPYRNSTILLARDNFGCGSSREHAPWALSDFGFKIIIAPSFADIFANNCVKNGILLLTFDGKIVDDLFEQTEKIPGVKMSADLESQKFTDANGKEYSFEIDSFSKECLLKGLDQIGWTSQFNSKIDEYEKDINQNKTWITFNNG